MNTMPLLPATASLPEIISAAEKLGMDIVDNDGLFTVYRFGDWYATCHKSALPEIVNFRIGHDNDLEVERKAQADRAAQAARAEQAIRAEINARIASMTEGFTPAAVLDRSGSVIAIVKADPKARYITLIDGVIDDVALNARERKISRSKVNLDKANRDWRVNLLPVRILNNCVVYEFYD